MRAVLVQYGKSVKLRPGAVIPTRCAFSRPVIREATGGGRMRLLDSVRFLSLSSKQ
jgi:hypothetical protein